MPRAQTGITKALADGTYLRLDASNDPMQGNLNMGGFSLIGSNAVGGNLTLDSTSNATKGSISLGESISILPNSTFTNTLGVLSWPRSFMREQTAGAGGADRFFLQGRGDRTEILSENGQSILFSANGPLSALPNGLYAQFGFRAGLYSSTAQLEGGMLLSGQAWIGESFGTTPGQAQLHIRSQLFPSAIIERPTTGTNGLVPSFVVRATTSNNMVDGFGAGIVFQLQDNAGVANNSARIYARRDGSDTTARIVWFPGASEAMTLRSSGRLGIGTSDPTSLLHVKGSLSLNLIPRTVNTTLAEAVVYPFSAAGGNRTATLPSSVDERIYTITRTDNVVANSLTLTGTGGQTIEGAASILMAPGENITVAGDGSQWYIIARYKPDTKVEIAAADSPYTVPTWVDEVIADTSAGNITVNLYAGASNIRPLTVKNAGAGTVTVDGNGAELIYGAATETLIQYENIIIRYHSTLGWL